MTWAKDMYIFKQFYIILKQIIYIHICVYVCVHIHTHTYLFMHVCIYRYVYGFSGGLDGKESTCKAADTSSIPGSGRSPGEGCDNPLQYSCLENLMDREELGSCSWGHTESDTTEQLSLSHIGTCPCMCVCVCVCVYKERKSVRERDRSNLLLRVSCFIFWRTQNIHMSHCFKYLQC